MMLRLSLPLLLLSGCIAGPPPIVPPVAEPRFSVFAFFLGETEGRGMLRVMFGKEHQVLVHGRASMTPSGALQLDQIIEEAGRKPRQRRWRLREVAPGRYEGALTDADGPVVATTNGNQLNIRYAMKDGLRAEQWLSLAPDRQSARNILVVRKLGMTVAVLEETIRRIGGSDIR